VNIGFVYHKYSSITIQVTGKALKRAAASFSAAIKYVTLSKIMLFEGLNYFVISKSIFLVGERCRKKTTHDDTFSVAYTSE